MESSTDLTRALLQLAALVDRDPEHLTGPLEALTTQARQAVASYRGVRVGLVEHGHEVALSAFVDDTGPASIRSTVRLPLVLLGADLGWSSSLVLYAGTPGAFVDLGADLSYLLGVPLRTARATEGADLHAPRPARDATGPVHGPVEIAVVVDGDLPPSSTASVLLGLAERTSIDRAIGLLLARGDTVEAAVARLQRQAAGRGERLADVARELLREASG